MIYIVLPNSMHAEFVLRGAKAGKHILCEKPMATSVRDCERMIAACNAAKVKLMIAYRQQYEPMNRAIVTMVREGKLGQVKSVIATNSQNEGDPSQWRLKRALSGGGCLPDVGIYCLNAARFLTGEEPSEVSGTLYQPKDDPRFVEVEETCSFTMKFPSGLIATCSSGYGMHRSQFLRLEGDKAWAELNPAFGYSGLKMRHAALMGEHDVISEPSIEAMDQFAAEMDHMSLCVQQNLQPHTPGEEGLQDQRITDAIYESARTGRVVKLAAPGEADAWPGAAGRFLATDWARKTATARRHRKMEERQHAEGKIPMSIGSTTVLMRRWSRPRRTRALLSRLPSPESTSPAIPRRSSPLRSPRRFEDAWRRVERAVRVRTAGPACRGEGVPRRRPPSASATRARMSTSPSTGLPLSFGKFAWPFHHSSSGCRHLPRPRRDSSLEGRREQPASRQDLRIHDRHVSPRSSPPWSSRFAESFIYNAIRKTMDQGQLELVKSGNRQPVPVTTRYYSMKQKKFVFNDTTEPQRREFLAGKVYWLSGVLGAGQPVWILDPRDAQYLNTTVSDLKQSDGTALIAEGLIALAPDAEYATPTEEADGEPRTVRGRYGGCARVHQADVQRGYARRPYQHVANPYSAATLLTTRRRRMGSLTCTASPFSGRQANAFRACSVCDGQQNPPSRHRTVKWRTTRLKGERSTI